MVDQKMVLGIDVDSKYLECWAGKDMIRQNGVSERFVNQEPSFSKFHKWLKSLNVQRIVMEASGGYEKKISIYLAKKGLDVHVVNPVQARQFTIGIGQRAKNDRLDAFALSCMGQVVKLSPFIPHSKELLELKALAVRREQLVCHRTEEQGRLKLAEGKIKKAIEKHIHFLKKEIEAIEKQMDELIMQDDKLNAIYHLLRERKGIGKVTARSLIALLPELGYLTRKQVTALAGLAPYDDESGKRKGKRRIKGGRFYVRKSLYMPALVAMVWDPPMKMFYQRLLEKGKPKKVAIVAVMRKMLIILNGTVMTFLKEMQQKKQDNHEKA